MIVKYPSPSEIAVSKLNILALEFGSDNLFLNTSEKCSARLWG